MSPLLFALLLSLTSLGALRNTGPASTPPLTVVEFQFDQKTINDAAKAANQEGGTSVTITHIAAQAPGKPVHISQDPPPGTGFAKTKIKDLGGPDEDTRTIYINAELIADKIEEVRDDARIAELICKLVLKHEFRHVTNNDLFPNNGLEGGKDREGGCTCEHLEDLQSDVDGAKAEIATAKADDSLTDAEKCKTVAALCKLIQEYRSIANDSKCIAALTPDPPGSPLPPEFDCPELLSNGGIIAPATECPDGDCPSHNTSFTF